MQSKCRHIARYCSTSFTESFVLSEAEPFVLSEAESFVPSEAESFVPSEAESFLLSEAKPFVPSDILLVDFMLYTVLFVFDPAMEWQQNKLMHLIKAYELFP